MPFLAAEKKLELVFLKRKGCLLFLCLLDATVRRGFSSLKLKLSFTIGSLGVASIFAILSELGKNAKLIEANQSSNPEMFPFLENPLITC
jgi:hypothetical protein